MLLFHGNRKQLTHLPWFSLILTSETTLEQTLKAIARAIRRIPAIEVFVPKDASDTLYIYARGKEQDVLSLTRIAGVQEVASTERLIPNGKDEPLVNRTPITLPDADIQQMIARSRQLHTERQQTIKRNSFVRVRDGRYKNYCGTVTTLKHNQATVEITLFSRTLILQTPTANLEVLNLPKSQQTYYATQTTDTQ